MISRVAKNSFFFLGLPSRPAETATKAIVEFARYELLVGLSVQADGNFRLSFQSSDLTTSWDLVVNVTSPESSSDFRFEQRFVFSPGHLRFAICHPIPDGVRIFRIRVSESHVSFARLVRGDNDATSYLNCILHCVFHLPLLRGIICSIEGPEERHPFLNLQLLLARMQSLGSMWGTRFLTESFKCDFSDRGTEHDPWDFWVFVKDAVIGGIPAGQAFKAIFSGQYNGDIPDTFDRLLLPVDGCDTLADSFAQFVQGSKFSLKLPDIPFFPAGW
jgi:hypothetical protein